MTIDYERFKINISEINRFSGQNIIFADKEKKDGGRTEDYLGTDDTVTILYQSGIEDVESVNLSDPKVATILEPLFEKYCQKKEFIQPRVFKTPAGIFADVNAHYQKFDEKVPRLVDIQLERYDERWITQLGTEEQAEAYHQYAFLLVQSALFDAVENCIAYPDEKPLSYKDEFNQCTQALLINYTSAQLSKLILAYSYALKSLSLRNNPGYERTVKAIEDVKRKIQSCIWTDFDHFKSTNDQLKDDHVLAKLVENKLNAIYEDETFWQGPKAYIDRLADQKAPKKEDKLFLEFLQRIKPNLW